MNKKTTFWKLLSNKRIEIPHYQRDYVQGWTENNANKAVDKYEENKIKDIREGLIEELFDSITRKKILSLNLVFGSANGSYEYFVPVDGQQRLTTLFLVHWYIALRAGELSKHYSIFSHFIYQTRKTSTEFFSLLCRFQTSTNINFAEAVQNNNHFFSNHKTDPTVLSALVMIAEIERVFVNIDFITAFDYLKGEECMLVFDVIDLKNYNLPDDLYIKMNGRGKPLTYFEKFKAWLPDYVNDNNRKEETKTQIALPDNWGKYLDTNWLDLFWKYKDDYDYIVDQEYMRFFNGMIQLLISADKSKVIDEELKTNVKLFTNPKESQDKNHELELTLEQYEKLACFSESNIVEIYKVLNILFQKDNELTTWLKNTTFFTSGEVKNRNTVFVDFISGQITYADRLRFYSMYKYLLAKSDNINEIDFKRWMRVLRNLIENSAMNEENYIKLIRKIDELSFNCKDLEILFFLHSQPDYDLLPFDNFQSIEERRKANLILDNPEWEDEIIIAESHSYFKGQIFFLLEMSDNEIPKFIEYRNKAISIFCDKWLIEEKSFIVHRALLAKGDYLFNLNGNRRGFCKNSQEWRERIFKDNVFSDSRPKGRIGILRELFEDLSVESIDKDLNRIIEGRSKDWRSDFIKYPSVIGYCGEKLMRFNDENEIYLLSKSQMSSRHTELRSWCFYNEYIKPINTLYLPFVNKRYYTTSKAGENPCAVIYNFLYGGEKYTIDIHFSKEGNYIISLFLGDAIGDDIELLTNLKESADLNMNWGDNKRLYFQCKTKLETHEQLIVICGKLQKMVTDEKEVLHELSI